jgi:hypothetical protein
MSAEYSWWAELRHGGCLITPSRLATSFPEKLDPLPPYLADRLRRSQQPRSRRILFFV